MFYRSKHAGKKQTLYIDTDIFNVNTYTGNNVSQSITNNIDLLNNGGMVLFKEKSSVTDFKLYDAVTKELITNNNSIQSTQVNGLTSFNINGFTVGSRLSANALSYVAYTFRKASKFFDIAKYSSASPSHALGVVPELIISKNLDYSTKDWVVYHKDYLNNFQLLLNTTSAKTNANMFYSSIPTVSSFGTNVSSYSGVNSIVIDTGGTGYTSAPSVTITNAVGDTTGSGASATANMVVSSIDHSTAYIDYPTIVSGGSYTSLPAGVYTNNGSGIVGFSGLGNVPNGGGNITGVRTYEGAAFSNKHNSSSPAVSFSNSGYGNGVQFGTPSTTAYGFSMNSIIVNSGGVYNNIPVISISGTQVGAVPFPTVVVSYSALPRTITSLSVSAGSGYTTAPTVTFPNMPGTSVSTSLNMAIENGKGIGTISYTGGSQYPPTLANVTVTNAAGGASTGTGATFTVTHGTSTRYYVPLVGDCTVVTRIVNAMDGSGGVPVLTAAIEPPPITGGTPATFNVGVPDLIIDTYRMEAICNVSNTPIRNLGSGFELPISAYITNPVYRHGEVLTVVPGPITGGGVISTIPLPNTFLQIVPTAGNRATVAAGITVTLTQPGTYTQGVGFSAHIASNDLTPVAGGYVINNVTIDSGGTKYYNPGYGATGIVISFSYSGPLAIGSSSFMESVSTALNNTGFTISNRQYSIGSVTITTNGSYTPAEAIAITTNGGVTIIGNNATGTGLSTAHASITPLTMHWQTSSVTCVSAGQGYNYLAEYVVVVRQPSQSNVVVSTYKIGVNSGYLHYLYSLIITRNTTGANYLATDKLVITSTSGYGSGATASITSLTPTTHPITAVLNSGGTGTDATPVITGGAGGTGFGVSANLTAATYTLTGLTLSGGAGAYGNGLSIVGLSNSAVTAATATLNTTQYYTLNSLPVNFQGNSYASNECSLTIGGYSATLDITARYYPAIGAYILANGYGSFTTTTGVTGTFPGGGQIAVTVVGYGYYYNIQSFSIIPGNNYILPPKVAIPGATAHTTLGTAIPGNYVSYLFATLAGISKVGSYTGNGSTQSLDCGFNAGARMVLIKRTDSTGDWYLWDNTRGITAGTDPHLSLNLTAAEVNTDDSIDPYPLGFAVNETTPTNINTLNASYIFLAIA